VPDDEAYQLEDRVVLVTGAAGGIGAAVCEAFRDCGARCLGVDLRGGGAVEHCDVTDADSVESAFDACARLGPITDVVHAAGVLSLGAVADVEPAEFRRVVDVNLTGSFLVARAAARRLGEGGTLTFVSSQAGLQGGALWAAYAASKGGVNRLVDCLAEELGPRGIRVNAVCPGTVETDMIGTAIPALAGMTGSSPEEVRARYLEGIPLGRFASPREVASVCVFLASPGASYLHGLLLPLDGGELTR
jgi:NAD(P)-dependent dehydrogenase (short-subunit alcohol dehydrogenase family)